MKYLKVIILSLTISVLSACGGEKKGERPEAKPSEITLTKLGESVYVWKEANVKAYWLQDNAQDRLMPRKLFADASDDVINELSLQEGIPSSVSSFLVETEGFRILFDTGVGASDSRLLAGLQAIGIQPEDIHYIYLTHFHGDHIGGLFKEGKAMFPNAKLYASKEEIAVWEQMPEDRNQTFNQLKALYGEQIQPFTFGDLLPGNVKAIQADGHTSGHTVYQVGTLLIIGDLIHGAALQFKYPEYCAAYDMDKQKAIETRKNILEYIRKNQLTVAGMHLPAPAFVGSNQLPLFE